MTLCRKCGKEIPDGEELCEDCKNEESQMDEAYLEELMQSMSDEEKEPENGEPAPVMDEQVEEKPAEEASDGEADVNELLTLLSQDYEDYDEPDSAVQPEEEVQTAQERIAVLRQKELQSHLGQNAAIDEIERRISTALRSHATSMDFSMS